MQARDGFTGVEIAHRIGRNLKRVNEIIHRVKNSVRFFSRKETVSDFSGDIRGRGCDLVMNAIEW